MPPISSAKVPLGHFQLMKPTLPQFLINLNSKEEKVEALGGHDWKMRGSWYRAISRHV